MSDYLDDLEHVKYQLKNLLKKQRHDGIAIAIKWIDDEIMWETEALIDAEEVRKSDEEDYQSRNR